MLIDTKYEKINPKKVFSTRARVCGEESILRI